MATQNITTLNIQIFFDKFIKNSCNKNAGITIIQSKTYQLISHPVCFIIKVSLFIEIILSKNSI